MYAVYYTASSFTYRIVFKPERVYNTELRLVYTTMYSEGSAMYRWASVKGVTCKMSLIKQSLCKQTRPIVLELRKVLFSIISKHSLLDCSIYLKCAQELSSCLIV